MRLDPLYTERLVVREFSTADREGLMSFVRDQDALKYMMFSMKDAAELDSFLSMATAGSADPARGDYHCAIALREHPGDCIGCVSLMGSILNPDSVELGYFIRRDFWGRGMTLEASRALIDWGFAKLKLHRVWGKCDTLNPGSARVLEKLGMKLGRHLPRARVASRPLEIELRVWHSRPGVEVLRNDRITRSFHDSHCVRETPFRQRRTLQPRPRRLSPRRFVC